MNRSTLFWMIMIIILLGYLGAFFLWTPFSWGIFGVGIVVWILLAILGWAVFGPIIKGD